MRWNTIENARVVGRAAAGIFLRSQAPVRRRVETAGVVCGEGERAVSLWSSTKYSCSEGTLFVPVIRGGVKSDV